MKPYEKEQADIAHIKKFVASAGTYANLVKQAKSKLKIIPSKKLKYIHSETPIYPWNIPCQNNAQIYIKRDDLTGPETSGNKIRKLEFLLADAISKGCDSVITIGGLQSNHCRSTAAAATRVGLKCYLCLRHTSTETPKSIDSNYLVSRLCGADVILFTPEMCKQVGGNNELLKIVKNQLELKGKKPYIIPLGGSNALGSWGYIEAMEEILQQMEKEKLKFDDIVVTAGSGGTLAGLALGNYLANTGMRIVGICSSDDAKYFNDEINDILNDFGVPKRTEEICTLIEGFVGKGYGINTPQELQFLTQISEKNRSHPGSRLYT